MEYHIYPRPISEQYSPGKKKDGGIRPCMNLKALNKFIPYKHFKMECLHCLKYLLEKNNFLCKIDLKDAYFSVIPCMSRSETVPANRTFK